MRLSEAAQADFAKHDTFVLRYGWLRKAHSFASLDPNSFSLETAPVTMGVGKNMVKAIKFWGLASKIIVEQSKTEAVPTRFGEAMFGEGGWDPYLEDPASLWLIHWALFSPPSRLPIWWHSFNMINAVEFSSDLLQEAASEQIDQIANWKNPAQSSIKKDVTALLHTYAPFNGLKNSGIDDRLDCPLRELGLIGQSTSTGNYRFNKGTTVSLRSEVATAIVLDYVDRVASDRNTITFGHLAREPGAPGKVLRLAEGDLIELLRPQINNHPDLGLLSPTGTHQLSWDSPPQDIGVQILNSYYPSSNKTASLGSTGDLPIKLETVN